MQPSQRKLSSYVATTALILVGLALAPTPVQATAAPMEFGINVGGIDQETNAGIKPNYAVLWAGPWTIDNWAYFDGQLTTVSGRGVTPVIQFYYWGNDLNTKCWNEGCWSGVHGHWKDQAGWTKLANQLAQHLNTKMAGKKVIIVVETEFNKGDMGYSETLDAGLAAKAWSLRNQYTSAVIAMGFGNWGHSGWGVFDRAMAASHEGGLQGMRASTRDSVTSYTGLPASLLKGAQELKNRFGKPVFIHDVAVSSYSEPEWLKHQATVLQSLFGRIGEFKAAGVHAIVYRALKDNPSATTAEYYGEAERHFGLRWSSNNTAKPAYNAWRNGILAERAGSTSPSPTTSTPSTTTTTTNTNLKVPSWGTASREAEASTTKTTGTVFNHASASGGKAWNLWSNGYVANTAEFASAGNYEVRIRAEGQLAQGIKPHMEVRVGGQLILGADPAAGYWGDHVGKVYVGGAGTKEVRVSFTNDLRTATDDRNLWLDRIEIKRIG
jgi:hypothetical protein